MNTLDIQFCIILGSIILGMLWVMRGRIGEIEDTANPMSPRERRIEILEHLLQKAKSNGGGYMIGEKGVRRLSAELQTLRDGGTQSEAIKAAERANEGESS